MCERVMRYLSVCSGIEAASVAWPGWGAVGFSEIEPFPSAVLKHHYPGVPNLGDMTRYREWEIGSIDLLVGGTPCQSFSVAGLRKGLEDPRGNLMLVYCGILDWFKPRWFVWENVPGVLSSNGGRDFGAFLGAVAELGYGWAYRVLDAQYFGVAQRRRRVFVVGCLGDWASAAKVLFEPESLSGNPAPRREAGKEVAGTFTARARSGGWGQDPNLAAGGYMRAVAPCVTNGPPFSRTGNERVEAEAMVVQLNPVLSNDPAAAICANEQRTYTNEGSVFQLRNVVGQPVAIQDVRAVNKAQNGRGWNDDGTAYTVDTHATQGVAVAFAQNQRDEIRVMEVAGALAAEPGMKQQTYLAQPAIAWDVLAPTLTASNDPSRSPQSAEVTQQVNAVYASSMQVRRLTPVECERLQGFPDGYTNIPWRGKPESPDGPRYKALGNSMAVPVMKWIGERIQREEEGRQVGEGEEGGAGESSDTGKDEGCYGGGRGTECVESVTG